MSALAMFSLKSPSLLAFDEGRAEPLVQKNIQTLFQVGRVPCDTYMREVLDELNPKDLRQCFLSVYQGYQFEHNFGHGRKNLHTVFTFLMMLAFLIDQIQEAACGLFQAALKSMKRRVRFWERMRSFFTLYLIESWTSLFETMKNRYSFKGVMANTL